MSGGSEFQIKRQLLHWATGLWWLERWDHGKGFKTSNGKEYVEVSQGLLELYLEGCVCCGELFKLGPGSQHVQGLFFIEVPLLL